MTDEQRLREEQTQLARDAMTRAVCEEIRRAAADWLVSGVTPGAIAAGAVSAAIEVMVAAGMKPAQISNSLYTLCDSAREQVFAAAEKKN